MPWRHPLSANHFAHHGGEAAHHLIAGHGPRAKTALGMTDHTLFLKDWRDGFGVADLRMVDIALSEVDQAPHGVAAGDCNGLVCKRAGNGVSGKML